jgi:ABC-type uncharacterized transport system permease subunit
MISYPMHIYPTWMRSFFTFVVPAIFLNYYPALFFLGKPDPFGLPAFAPFLSPLIGLAIRWIGFLEVWHPPLPEHWNMTNKYHPQNYAPDHLSR